MFLIDLYSFLGIKNFELYLILFGKSYYNRELNIIFYTLIKAGLVELV